MYLQLQLQLQLHLTIDFLGSLMYLWCEVMCVIIKTQQAIKIQQQQPQQNAAKDTFEERLTLLAFHCQFDKSSSKSRATKSTATTTTPLIAKRT